MATIFYKVSLEGNLITLKYQFVKSTNDMENFSLVNKSAMNYRLSTMDIDCETLELLDEKSFSPGFEHGTIMSIQYTPCAYVTRHRC